jgi:hypothetical protein
MVIDLEEIVEKIYSDVHHFLITNVGEDLDQDIIDINLEMKNEELFVEIYLYLELSTFSDQDVQKIAEAAIMSGINTADKICPPVIVQVHNSLQSNFDT